MFTKNSFNGKADPVADAIKAIAEADYALKMEALKGDQTKLDKNKNNKLDADDFKIIRGEKKTVKEEDALYEKTVQQMKSGTVTKAKEAGKKKMFDIGRKAFGTFDPKKYSAAKKLSKEEVAIEEDDKPRSAGSVFDKDVAKSFTKKKGEGTGHEAKETKTGTQYTKKAPKDSEETNEDFNSFKAKLKSGVKKVARVLGGPDDKGQLKNLQDKMGAKPGQQHGKPSMAKYNEEVEGLDEAKKLVGTHGEGVHTAKVYHDKDWNEYQVHYYKHGKHMGEGPVSYHGNDKQDAHDTAKAGIKHMDATHTHKEEFDLEEIDPALVEEFMQTEEFDQLDELSKTTLSKYINRAAYDAGSSGYKAGKAHAEDKPEFRNQNKRFKKRLSGIRKATDRLAKEEFDQLDELSKGTLASYAKKATDDVSDHSFTAGHEFAKGRKDWSLKQDKKSESRQKGINKAVDRLAKEEVDINEETPNINVRSLYTKTYAKHGGTADKANDAQSKAYAEVEKKHGTEARNSLEAYHKKNRSMDEEVESIDELSTQTLSSYAKKRGSQLRGGYEDKDKIKGMNAALRKVKQNSAKKD